LVSIKESLKLRIKHYIRYFAWMMTVLTNNELTVFSSIYRQVVHFKVNVY